MRHRINTQDVIGEPADLQATAAGHHESTLTCTLQSPDYRISRGFRLWEGSATKSNENRRWTRVHKLHQLSGRDPPCDLVQEPVTGHMHPAAPVRWFRYDGRAITV